METHQGQSNGSGVCLPLLLSCAQHCLSILYLLSLFSYLGSHTRVEGILILCRAHLLPPHHLLQTNIVIILEIAHTLPINMRLNLKREREQKDTISKPIQIASKITLLKRGAVRKCETKDSGEKREGEHDERMRGKTDCQPGKMNSDRKKQTDQRLMMMETEDETDRKGGQTTNYIYNNRKQRKE